MYFFFNSATFSAASKTAKGRELQLMSDRFNDIIVEGDNAYSAVVGAMREQAAEIDKKYPRGGATFIFHSLDDTGTRGVIAAIPLSDRTVSDRTTFEVQPYFRIYYHQVAFAATIPEAVALAKGGDK